MTLILSSGETEGQRAARKGGDLWARTPYSVDREIAKVKRWRHYRRGLACEFLRDFERQNGLEEDRSENMIHAAGILLQTAASFGAGFNALTPPRIIQSRTCAVWVRADLEPSMMQLLAPLNPAPNLVIRGNLSQRFTLKVAVDAVGTGALGSTTLKMSFDGTTNYTITGFVTTDTLTQLVENGRDTGIWISCAVGPYDAADEWVSRLGALTNQSGNGTDRDFINRPDNINTCFDYTPFSSTIRNRAYISSVATRSTFLTSQYVPADPGTTPSFVRWVGRSPTFVTTGRLFGTGTVNQFCVRQADPSPNIAQAGQVAVNSTAAMTIGTFFGCEAYFADSTSDRLRIGTTAVGPAPAGGCQSGVPNSGITLGARANTGALPSTMDFAEFGLWEAGEPTALELTRSRAYNTIIYGVAT